MSEMLNPPSEEELDWLDDYLLNRVDDELYEEGKDEGIFDLGTLDGFFAAIVSGPQAISPSQWLPQIWGDFEPEWESEAEAEKVISLLIRFMNGVSTFLIQAPEDYEPMFLEREFKGKVFWVVDEWCEGYLRGVNMDSEQWQTESPLMQDLLAPILAFTQQGKFSGHELKTDAEVRLMQESIKPNILEIHAHWLAQRSPPQEKPQTFRRTEPRPGRNDPCPCGSGKKYKKCCLH